MATAEPVSQPPVSAANPREVVVERLPAGAQDRAVYAGAANQVTVRRVSQRVSLHLGNVALNERQRFSGNSKFCHAFDSTPLMATFCGTMGVCRGTADNLSCCRSAGGPRTSVRRGSETGCAGSATARLSGKAGAAWRVSGAWRAKRTTIGKSPWNPSWKPRPSAELDLGVMSVGPFRVSVCNELFEKAPFIDHCRLTKKAGWDGIEIAPFTLQTNATELPAEGRRQARDLIEGEGLEFVGLHWLTVGPKGLHVTTPDATVRQKSWDYVRGLADLCSDLRPRDQDSGGVMIFGSPGQRKTVDGATRERATRNYVDGLRSITPHLEAVGVTLLVEALPIEQCDVIQTMDEAASIVDEISSPAVQTMFDSHNAINEEEPHAALVEKHWSKIRHIHINELDGSYPRPGGGYDFKPVLQVAKEKGYGGWVSMEVFDFSPGAERMVNEAIDYLRDEIAQLD